MWDENTLMYLHFFQRHDPPLLWTHCGKHFLSTTIESRASWERRLERTMVRVYNMGSVRYSGVQQVVHKNNERFVQWSFLEFSYFAPCASRPTWCLKSSQQMAMKNKQMEMFSFVKINQSRSLPNFKRILQLSTRFLKNSAKWRIQWWSCSKVSRNLEIRETSDQRTLNWG